MKNEKRVIDQYLREVSVNLNCPKSVKSVFMAELRENILSFHSQHQEISKDKLYAEFGIPEEISDGFFNRSDYKLFLDKAKKKIIHWKAASLLAIVLSVLTIALLILIVQDMSSTIYVSTPY